MQGKQSVKVSAQQLNPDDVRRRIVQGDVLVSALRESRQRYKEIYEALKIQPRDAYKYRCVAENYGKDSGTRFDEQFLYATQWAVLLILSSPSCPREMRHQILHLVHQGMSDKERGVINDYTIEHDLSTIHRLCIPSNADSIEMLYISMLEATGQKFTASQREILETRPYPYHLQLKATTDTTEEKEVITAEAEAFSEQNNESNTDPILNYLQQGDKHALASAIELYVGSNTAETETLHHRIDELKIKLEELETENTMLKASMHRLVMSLKNVHDAAQLLAEEIDDVAQQ